MKQEISQILNILEDIKASDIKVIDVSKLTAITDTIIICTGRSVRHVKSVAEHVREKYKITGKARPNCQGSENGQWVIVDLNAQVVHVMLPEIREFYQLEKLWDEHLFLSPPAAS